MIARIGLALPLLALASAAAAEPQTYRLSDAEREAVLAQAESAEKPPVLTVEAAPESSVLTRSLYPEFYAAAPGAGGPADRRPHGEVSTFVGSGGAYGFAGTTVMPLGDRGMAAFSFSTGRGPQLRGPYGGLSAGFNSFGFGYSSR